MPHLAASTAGMHRVKLAWCSILAVMILVGCRCGDSDEGRQALDAGGEDRDDDGGRDADGDLDLDASIDGADGPGTDAGSDAGTDSALDIDQDGDGLGERAELEIAERYLPFLSVSPDDGCPESAILFRVRPHPEDHTKLHVLYDVLYDDDCGTNGHPGDDEVFAMAVDPALPAPFGILALVAIAHQATFCDQVSRCQTCGPDGNTCSMTEVDDARWPVVFASREKHAGYLRDGVGRGRCDGGCFGADWCDLAETGARPPMANAGEPDHPLLRDLTEAGLVTAEHGFENAVLMSYDPWGGAEFGDAGVVSEDLVDPAFDVPIPDC